MVASSGFLCQPKCRKQVKADLKMGFSLSLYTVRQNQSFKVNLGQSQPAAASIEAGNDNSY